MDLNQREHRKLLKDEDSAKLSPSKKLSDCKNLKKSFHCFDNDGFTDENGLQLSVRNKKVLPVGTSAKLPDVEILECSPNSFEHSDISTDCYTIVGEDELDRLIMGDIVVGVDHGIDKLEERDGINRKLVKETLKILTPRRKQSMKEQVGSKPQDGHALVAMETHVPNTGIGEPNKNSEYNKMVSMFSRFVVNRCKRGFQ